MARTAGRVGHVGVVGYDRALLDQRLAEVPGLEQIPLPLDLLLEPVVYPLVDGIDGVQEVISDGVGPAGHYPGLGVLPESVYPVHRLEEVSCVEGSVEVDRLVAPVMEADALPASCWISYQYRA